MTLRNPKKKQSRPPVKTTKKNSITKEKNYLVEIKLTVNVKKRENVSVSVFVFILYFEFVWMWEVGDTTLCNFGFGLYYFFYILFLHCSPPPPRFPPLSDANVYLLDVRCSICLSISRSLQIFDSIFKNLPR